MNALSWLLYLASVVGSLNVIITMALFTGIIILLVFAGILVFCGEPYVWSWENREEKLSRDDQRKAYCRSYIGHSPKFLIPLAIATAIIPSQSTVYAIAASEAGERALSSETGGKAMQALNAWLDRQIAGEEMRK